MADAVTSQTILDDGGRNLVMKFTNISDGTGRHIESEKRLYETLMAVILHIWNSGRLWLAYRGLMIEAVRET